MGTVLVTGDTSWARTPCVYRTTGSGGACGAWELETGCFGRPLPVRRYTFEGQLEPGADLLAAGAEGRGAGASVSGVDGADEDLGRVGESVCQEAAEVPAVAMT